MKISRLSLIVTAALFVAAPAFADGNTVATVNVQQIMQESTAAKSVREQLESKQKAFQSEVAKKQDALQKEKQELDKKQSVLSKDAYNEKERALINKVTSARKDMDSKKALLDNAFSHSLGDIQKAVTDIITDLAKEKGFTMAIPTSELLYGDPKLDITDEVLKRLNQKLPKLDVKFDSESKSDKE